MISAILLFIILMFSLGLLIFYLGVIKPWNPKLLVDGAAKGSVCIIFYFTSLGTFLFLILVIATMWGYP